MGLISSLLAIFRSGLWGLTCPWRLSLIPDLLMSITGSHNTADMAIRGQKQNHSGWGRLGGSQDHYFQHCPWLAGLAVSTFSDWHLWWKTVWLAKEAKMVKQIVWAQVCRLILPIRSVTSETCHHKSVPPLWFGTWGWIHFSTPHIVDILKMQRSPQNAGRILHLLKVCHHIPKIPPCCEMAFMKHFFQNIS